MSNWSAWKFTDAGKAVQTKVEAGSTLTFTKLVLGDGYADSVDDYKEKTALVEPKITCSIESVTVQDNKFARIKAVFTNVELTEAVAIREAGLYAKDPDTGEDTLFAVAIDEAADTIPAKGTAAVITKEFNFYIMVGDAENVTATIDPSVLVTKETFAAHTESLTAHASLFGSIFRQPSTAYSVGDVVYVKGAGAKYRLACVTAGTTSADELAIPSGAKAGDSITDGTAIWKVEEIEGMITAIESDGGLVTLTRVDGSTEQLQIVANNAGAHNAVYRGKDLTAYFDSGEMSKAIAAGTFKDIYPGDYITKSVTVNGTTYSDVKWMVGDIDYFLGHGDTSILTQHHVLMFPDTCLGNSYMNPTNTTEGAYMGSYMYTTMIPLVNAGIQAAFGTAHVVSHREAMSKLINATMACASGNGWTGSTYWWSGEWADVLSNLFTENMVYGANIFSSSPQDVCNGCRQVAAFRHDSSLYIGGTKRESWWLRAVAASYSFANVLGGGYADCNDASSVLGVRPYFLLA